MDYPLPSTRRGLTEDELAEIYANTREVLRRHRVNQQGRDWYADAYAWCVELEQIVDIPADRLAWALAALSPMNRWQQNKTDLVDLITTGKCGTFEPGPSRAARILAGEDPGEVLGGNKVRAFGDNIANHASSTAVTLDTHMVNALGLPDRYIERAGVYRTIESAFQDAARERRVLPSQLQASVWIDQRGRAE